MLFSFTHILVHLQHFFRLELSELDLELELERQRQSGQEFRSPGLIGGKKPQKLAMDHK